MAVRCADVLDECSMESSRVDAVDAGDAGMDPGRFVFAPSEEPVI